MKLYKTLFTLHFWILCLTGNAVSQPIFKHWDQRFGGSKDDSPSTLQRTTDGGFLFGGTSISGISGDKTQPNWDPGLVGSDFWVVKTDSNGVKLWDKRFGGINSEVLVRMITTNDGGFILAGQSFSGISGDKTQPNWDPTQQSYDYWVVKVNGAGLKEWDKRFGGNSLELLGGIASTANGGYVISGSSFSGISGDKTQASQGSWDYWVVSIDSLGNKIWDKRFGGTDDDFATSVVVDANGSILIGGYSQSLANGDKSQFPQGQWDYWVVKTDVGGNKIWDKTFGGNYTDWLFDMTATLDGSYVLAGQSFSENTGDKSEPNHDPTPSSSDRWIIKIDNNGSKIWDRTIGGTETEDLRRIMELPDGGFLLSGESYSPISGNKTENNLGVEQTWVVKTDSTGIPIWDKTIFSNGHDEEGTAIALPSGCLVSVNYTLADTGGYKTQMSRGDGDYWLVKLCDAPLGTGFNEASQILPEMDAFPNPCQESLHLSWPSLNEPLLSVNCTITDLLGKTAMMDEALPYGANQHIINTENLSNGLYLLTVEFSTASQIWKTTKKFTVAGSE